MPVKINAIITGVTGMVGEGVLHECLQHPDVESVLIINRRPSGFSHPKLKEIVHKDFFDLAPINDQLSGYNACYFCLGVSSVGMKADDYYRYTYTLTMHVGDVLSELNPGMTFCYVTGAGTDTTEQGRLRWARVKGKTENDLRKLPFAQVFNFRPGLIRPSKGMKNVHGFYKAIDWILGIVKEMNHNAFCTNGEIGRAMIRVTQQGFERPTIEVRDIIGLGK